MVRRTTRVLYAAAVSVAAATAAVASSAFPAAAEASGPAAATAGGWQRTHAQDFVAAAGTRCKFALRGEVLFDREYIRTTRTFRDGRPRVQEVVGPLIVRYSNEATKAAVVRDLSARAVFRYFPNGSYALRL